ncbi:hypothetical protein SAMN05421805_103335 [Saccharopolyspora antimicrobica]|uniref:Anti-sigma-M factor RsmA n=1 Tax=Saccharopolyspora antimicrobica TaxID=455193 RepID=A0A1I4XBM0_9PSEU|nr:hypothetical protein [Saccharopolyspora antimicrobica]RKT84404.1 hypothetical protein ATL45_2719 [Saccharopolyspora antimicrobica]SFN22710.1 hypothetical protein SAMN05421805_103335 [Saccharopolyspora antimicrobica]
MSGEHRRTGAPQGPPWSLDLLADLHAGVLDEQTAEELRSQVQDDPEAREILAALDATSAELAELPPLTIPDDVSARIDAALENEVRAWAEQQQPAVPAAPAAEQGGQVIDFAAAKQRRRRRFTLGAGMVGVAAAAAAVVFSVLPNNTESSTPQAQQPPSPAPSSKPPLALQGGQVSLNGQQFADALNSSQYLGSLSDPQQLLGCLQANGVTSGKPLGAREITLDGKPAQLMVLPAGALGEFRLLTVAPDCGPDNPAKISDSTFGG